MGYNRELSPAQRCIMQQVVGRTTGGEVLRLEDQLMALKEGQGATLRDSSVALGQIRGAIYNWLHVNGLKSYYQLRSLSATSLLVLRREEPKPEVIVEARLDSKVEDFVKEYLLDLDDDESVQAQIDLWDAPKEHKIAAFEEWLRFQGRREVG